MLKLNSGFEVRNVCGENIVVAMGEHNIDFSHVIALNETSLLIWKMLEKGVEGIDEIVKAIMDDYEVDETICKADVQTILDQLAQYEILASK